MEGGKKDVERHEDLACQVCGDSRVEEKMQYNDSPGTFTVKPHNGQIGLDILLSRDDLWFG